MKIPEASSEALMIICVLVCMEETNNAQNYSVSRSLSLFTVQLARSAKQHIHALQNSTRSRHTLQNSLFSFACVCICARTLKLIP